MSFSNDICIVTLGCAKNEVDSRQMRAALEETGYRFTDEPADARCIIVNTCSFISDAIEESIDTILDLAGLDTAAEQELIVAGCLPSRFEEELVKELPEVGCFVPCADEEGIVRIVADRIGEPMSAGDDAEPSEFAFPVSAYVKISDGCDRFCSFCAIPYIRGRYHSYSREEIEGEVRALVEGGVREICLIAQDIGVWGSDLEGEQTLATLLDGLAIEFPDTWFRLLYLQPDGVTDELLDVMSAHENVCTYLDIPLQHVSERLLKAMHRRGSGPEYLELIEHIREKLPGIALRTTLIAGFPGETEEEFEELCDFLDDARFDYVGVFPYSQEDGTRAAELLDQIDEDEKLRRAQILRDAADGLSSLNIANRVGLQAKVLIEGREDDGQLFGRCTSQAPEVDGYTYVNAGEIGDIVDVTIVDTLFYEMEGEVER